MSTLALFQLGEKSWMHALPANGKGMAFMRSCLNPDLAC